MSASREFRTESGSPPTWRASEMPVGCLLAPVSHWQTRLSQKSFGSVVRWKHSDQSDPALAPETPARASSHATNTPTYRPYSGKFHCSHVTAYRREDGTTPHFHSHLHSSEAKRGSILVAVLAIILLLSFIITRFMDEAVEDLEYRAIFNEPADVRSFAYSMLEVALATVHEVALIDEGKLYAPEQGWANPIRYAGIEIPNGWEVHVQITDEGGKLPLNTMDEAMLNRMLEESFDFDFGTARELSSMLKDWTDPDDNRRLNGAESEDYLRRNPPYRAANGPLQSLEELRLLEIWEDEFFDEDGRPNELFHKLDSMVSVINSGAANLNSSPQEVLDLLAQEGGFDEDYLFDGLRDLPYLTEVPGSAGGASTGVEVRLLRVTVSLWRGQVPFTVSALVEPNFSSDEAGGATESAQAPGTSSNDAPKTGATSEQEAISYPFKILQVSEYTQGRPGNPPARYSALDIGEESDSF